VHDGSSRRARPYIRTHSKSYPPTLIPPACAPPGGPHSKAKARQKQGKSKAKARQTQGKSKAKARQKQGNSAARGTHANRDLGRISEDFWRISEDLRRIPQPKPEHERFQQWRAEKAGFLRKYYSGARPPAAVAQRSWGGSLRSNGGFDRGVCGGTRALRRPDQPKSGSQGIFGASSKGGLACQVGTRWIREAAPKGGKNKSWAGRSEEAAGIGGKPLGQSLRRNARMPPLAAMPPARPARRRNNSCARTVHHCWNPSCPPFKALKPGEKGTNPGKRGKKPGKRAPCGLVRAVRAP
jgi:hypothetical protein